MEHQATTRFSVEVTRKAYELIHTGREHFGSFWSHRTSTCQRLGYGEWKDVPENIQECVNHIGRSTRMRRGQKSQPAKRTISSAKLPHPVRPKHTGFVINRETLEDIWGEVVPVPKIATARQIRVIREYITVQAGFDPKRILLGIASRMEK